MRAPPSRLGTVGRAGDGGKGRAVGFSLTLDGKGGGRVSPASRDHSLKVRKGLRSAGPSSGLCVLSTVSTKPQRSAQPLSASVPSGGPVQALPGPEPPVSRARDGRRGRANTG
ncbi:hypothetical protein EIB18_17685 [Caulobacter vibrioides]|uniref:hypothetical protein n=1 Tax=Caulobacter vibrioides TaxID=155892 RepID=UPI000C78F80C|nr:hypothetical protein [Caulobacter vibrioides]AVG21570.1 hypothetical protein CA608_20450 [Caulobacter vibrioides]AZH14355.1 hypothetical protein EIB18_17685 [Caulobacter vibrioides]PLR10929.1 hypothetical protein CVUC_12690 [Caulobacter vibrioides]